MLSTDREGLTRGAGGQQIHGACNLQVVETANVTRKQAPTLERLEAEGLVLAKRVATVFVPFNNRVVVKTGLLDAERETTRAAGNSCRRISFGLQECAQLRGQRLAFL